MGTSVNSFFFHKDHNNLTVEDIRKNGFAAKEAKNGFIEAVSYAANSIAEKKLILDRELTRIELSSAYQSQSIGLLNLLINNVKEDCPPIMHYMYDMDDSDVLTIYLSPTTTQTIEDIHYEPEQKITNHLKDIYGLENFYTDIGFARYSEQDIPTEEQIAETNRLKSEFEDRRYLEWHSEFEQLAEHQKLKLLHTAMTKNQRDWMYRDTTDEEKATLKYIERYIGDRE